MLTYQIRFPLQPPCPLPPLLFIPTPFAIRHSSVYYENKVKSEFCQRERLPPLQNDNFSKCAIWGRGYEYFYFLEKLCSVLNIFKFLYFKPFPDLPTCDVIRSISTWDRVLTFRNLYSILVFDQISFIMQQCLWWRDIFWNPWISQNNKI